MPERRFLTAEQRMNELERARARLRRQRLEREVAGPVWRRMVTIVPALFDRAGEIRAHVLSADREAVIESLREDAVFANDTAMRLLYGKGFLAGGDVHAYLTSTAPLERLGECGLIEEAQTQDTTLVRPWPGPPRLIACIVEELPSSCVARSGHRTVTPERLRRELIGTVGGRVDLFGLLERAERDAVDGGGRIR